MNSRAGTKTAGGRIEVTLRRTTAGLEMARRQWDVTTHMAGMQFAPQYAVPDVVEEFGGDARLGDREPEGRDRVARSDGAAAAAYQVITGFFESRIPYFLSSRGPQRQARMWRK